MSGRPVRILAFVPRAIPSDEGVFVGGAVNSAIRQIQALSSRFEVTLITGVPKEAAAKLRSGSAPSGIDLVPVEVNQSMSGWMWGGESAIKTIRAGYALHKNAPFELVHGHSGHPMYATTTYSAGRLMGIPTVHTLYCPLQVKSEHGSYPLTGARWSRLIFNRLNAVTGISHNIVDSLSKAGVDGSITAYLPTAMDVQRFNPNISTKMAARKEFGLPQEEPTILFVGNLTTAKGIDILLDAAPSVLSHHPSSRFVFTFDLDLKDSALEKRRKIDIVQRINVLDLQERVEFRGIVQDMPRLPFAADVVVAPFLSTVGPSDYPLVLMEAMAVGRAVVSTFTGGIPEIIDQGKTGVLVPPGNAQELAQAIVSLLSDPDYRCQMGQRAAAFIPQAFGPYVVGPQYEQLYTTIIQKGVASDRD